ncbi:MAG: hypothetical protein U0793_30030 [Gemmataceae bacterium]
MRFWIREILGVLLILGGLYSFLLTISIITNNPSAFFNALHTTVIGIFVFRGGIHLLKVALAARVCMLSMRTPGQPKPGPAAGPLAPALPEW